jgi:hypothetical protein
LVTGMIAGLIPSRCPISDEPAKFAPDSADAFVEFDCPACGRFRIAEATLLMFALSGYAPADRFRLLELARSKAAVGGMPLVVHDEV